MQSVPNIVVFPFDTRMYYLKVFPHDATAGASILLLFADVQRRFGCEQNTRCNYTVVAEVVNYCEK